MNLEYTETLNINRIRNKALYASIILLVILLIMQINPESSYLPECSFKALTGHSCLTCGITRSLSAASHFHLAESVNYHPIGPVIYFSLIFMFLIFAFESISRKEIMTRIKPQFMKILLLSFFSLWGIFWIVRFISEL